MIDFGPAGFAAAFAAGFITFVSPCVLPIVPGYVSFVCGLTSDEMGVAKQRVITATATFVLGFGSMFVLLGAGAAWFGDVLLANRRTLEIIGGAFLVLAGLVFVGIRLPMAVYRERRYHLRERLGPATPVVAGAAFAVGWTPCIGPTLAGILALSAAGGNPTQGALLLGVFSLGLGVPFLLFGLWMTRGADATAFLRRHARRIGMASGVLLIAFGLLLASGQLVRLTGRLGAFGIEV